MGDYIINNINCDRDEYHEILEILHGDNYDTDIFTGKTWEDESIGTFQD